MPSKTTAKSFSASNEHVKLIKNNFGGSTTKFIESLYFLHPETRLIHIQEACKKLMVWLKAYHEMAKMTCHQMNNPLEYKLWEQQTKQEEEIKKQQKNIEQETKNIREIEDKANKMVLEYTKRANNIPTFEERFKIYEDIERKNKLIPRPKDEKLLQIKFKFQGKINEVEKTWMMKMKK